LRQDQELFFGRDREARNLSNLTIAHPEVLLYSPAGAGKTSLLNAQLIPMLEREGCEVLPPARLGGPLEIVETGTGATSNIYVLHTLLSWDLGRSDPSELARMTLRDYLAGRQFSSTEPDLSAFRIAIFDQFEELFTLYPAQWEQRQELIEQVRDALDADRHLRVIFAMREDYVACLDPYLSRFPGRLQTHFRLQGLREEAALEAITRPLQGTGRRLAPGVAEKLVDSLLRVTVGGLEGWVVARGEIIDPFQLQVVCRSLFERLDPNTDVITEDYLSMSGVNQALSSFYDHALEIAAEQSGVKEGRLRRWFGTMLITHLGTRGLVLRGAQETGGIPNSVVDMLVDLHALKAEFRHGAIWYELPHDRLVEPILTSNRQWFAANEPAAAVSLDARVEAWEKQGRPESLLFSELEVNVIEHWLSSETAGGLSHSVYAFLQASQSATGRRKLRRELSLSWVATALLVAILAGIIIWLLQH